MISTVFARPTDPSISSEDVAEGSATLNVAVSCAPSAYAAEAPEIADATPATTPVAPATGDTSDPGDAMVDTWASITGAPRPGAAFADVTMKAPKATSALQVDLVGVTASKVRSYVWKAELQPRGGAGGVKYVVVLGRSAKPQEWCSSRGKVVMKNSGGSEVVGVKDISVAGEGVGGEGV